MTENQFDIPAGLRSRKESTFNEALARAISDGEAGEAALVSALGDLTGWRRVPIAAALAHCEGPAGPPALVAALATRGPHSRDLRCASIKALASRCKGKSALDIAKALTQDDPVVRRYAESALAGIPDAPQWFEILLWFKVQLEESVVGKRERSWVVSTVAYLTRHAPQEGDELRLLVSMLRDGWSRFTSAEREWLTKTWPEIASGPAPDSQVQGPSSSLS